MIKKITLVFALFLSLPAFASNGACIFGHDTANLDWNHPLCKFRKGQEYFEKEDRETSRKLWEEVVALKPFPQKYIKYQLIARENLGFLYFYGFGIQEDKTKGFNHWIKASKLGGLEADAYLCNAYFESDMFKEAINRCVKAEAIYAKKKYPTKEEIDEIEVFRENLRISKENLKKGDAILRSPSKTNTKKQG